MKTRITDLLSIRSPILLGGMAGVTDAVLAAAVSEAGGLGTIAAAKESGRGLKQAVADLRKLTEKPFAVNIPLIVPQVEELIAGVIESRVPVVITAAGNPALYTSTLKEAGITVIHVIPCVDAARKAERAGVDALIAEGFESGGFASPFEIGTLALIPQVVDATEIPVIAAGGVADARGYMACLILGAEGVSVGTAFLAAAECSRIGSAWRSQLIGGHDTSTKIVGRGVMPLRMLINSSSESLEELIHRGASKKEVAQFVFNTDAMSSCDGPFPCGQAVGLVKGIRTARGIMKDFVDGANRLINRFAAVEPY
jgi:enoyl-[acyl-carrier protein] reductase II